MYQHYAKFVCGMFNAHYACAKQFRGSTKSICVISVNMRSTNVYLDDNCFPKPCMLFMILRTCIYKCATRGQKWARCFSLNVFVGLKLQSGCSKDAECLDLSLGECFYVIINVYMLVHGHSLLCMNKASTYRISCMLTVDMCSLKVMWICLHETLSLMCIC